MPLPRAVQLSQGVGLQVIDFAVDDLQAVAKNGTITVQYSQVDPDQLWRVERIVVTSTSAAQLAVTVYAGNGAPLAIQARDWTPLPAGFVGVAEYPQFLTVKGGAQLTIAATGANANDQMTVSTQYQLIQRVIAGAG